MDEGCTTFNDMLNIVAWIKKTLISYIFDKVRRKKKEKLRVYYNLTFFDYNGIEIYIVNI